MDFNTTQFSLTSRLVLRLCLFINVFLTLGNLMEVFKGNKLFTVALLCFLLSLINSVGLIYFYRNESKFFQEFSFWSFLGVYVFSLFSTHCVGVYVYIVPLIFLYILYYDVKFMRKCLIIVYSLNIIRIIWLVVFVKQSGPTFITDYSVQVASITIFCIIAYLGIKVTHQMNSESIGTIENARKQQAEILESVLELGRVLDTQSKEIYAVVSELEKSSHVMTTTMNDITVGIKDTTQNIQTQSHLTQDIQHIILNTSDASKVMSQISLDTIDEINKGKKIIEELGVQTSAMNINSDTVYTSMLALQDKTIEIGRITSVITDIAEQTNILSLNAAIESARAGEAGRGFAIVADEVRKLATQTSSSANTITTILHELENMVQSSVSAMTEFRTTNISQTELIQDTESIFNTTINGVTEVNKNIQLVSDKIQGLLSSTDQIVSSIQEISSTSEANLANLQESYAATETNNAQITQTKSIAQILLQTAEQVRQYE